MEENGIYVVCLISGKTISKNHIKIMSFHESYDSAVNSLTVLLSGIYKKNVYPFAAIFYSEFGGKYYGTSIDPTDIAVFSQTTYQDDPDYVKYVPCDSKKTARAVVDMIIMGKQ